MRLAPRSAAKSQLGPEAREVGAGIARVQEMLAPQVRRVGGEGQAMAGELRLEPVAVLAAGWFCGIGWPGSLPSSTPSNPSSRSRSRTSSNGTGSSPLGPVR